MRNYIPVKKHWLELYDKFPYFMPMPKFPIENIKIDKSLFSYANEVSKSDVLYMLIHFDREAWEPILINEDYCLLDGQHRLEVARQMGLSYIDAVMTRKEINE